MMEMIDKLYPYVLKLFPSSKKHKMRYGRNGFIDLPAKVERLISQNFMFCNHPFGILVTFDKVNFTFCLCNQAEIGFTIVTSCSWDRNVPIHILYRFKIANDCTMRELDSFSFNTGSDL